MKKLFSIALILCLLIITMSANTYQNNGFAHNSERDTIGYEAIEITDSIFFNFLSSDDHVVSDTISDADYVIVEGVLPFYHLGESSAELYAGKEFSVKNPDGSEFEYRVNDDGVSVTLIGGKPNGTPKLVVPSSVEALDSYFFVTEIGNFAFTKNRFGGDSLMKGVEQLVISEGVTTVGQNAFDSSSDLEVVDLPASLKIIPYCIFFNCGKLREVRIPDNSKITSIESFAFAGCAALESFRIPIKVTQIGEGPWRGCTSLQSLSIQEDNYDFIVEDGVLYKDWLGDLIQYPAGKRDKSYQVLYGTKAICNSAFYGNPYLEAVSIPASTDSISHIAFYDCQSLETVNFSDKVTFIGNSAFGQCPNLRNIILYGTPVYTNSTEDNYYNTFDPNTTVSISPVVPKVKLPKNKDGILASVMSYLSTFRGFYSGKFEDNAEYGFPEFYGEGRWLVYGNAGPKKDVLNVLSAIPNKFLKKELVDDRGRITRIYLDKSRKKNPRLLYFYGGIGGNDLVVALFENGDLSKIEKHLKDTKD